MAYDWQVVTQAILYLVTSITGFVVSIPTGLTVNQFENKCILFADISWKNKTYFHYSASSASLCNFPVGVAVFACILYGLGMGIYNFYAACRTKDSNVGFQMWVMPFIMANSLVTLLFFVISCIISIGLKKTCDGLEKGYDGAHGLSCPDSQKINWNFKSSTNVDGSHFYDYLKVAEVASWIAFLLWLLQVVFYVVRFIRIRRFRAKDMGSETDQPPATASDTAHFGSALPSA